MDAEHITEITTPTEATLYLLDLARAEADRLKLAAKLYRARPEQCPPDVRKKAIKHQHILTAIKLVQGAKQND